MIHNIDNIIARILSGESSSDDFLKFSEWLQTDEKNRTEFCQLKDYWDAEVSYSNHIGQALELKRIEEKIGKNDQRKKNRQLWIRVAPIAAVITLFLLISSVFYLQHEKESKPVEYFTYISGNHISTFTLPDHTKVTLNKNSKLTYTNLFGEKLRGVTLTGEAYFEVTKDPSRVFEVQMDDAAIRVLGTKFNVNTNLQNDIVATLVEGCIRFESGEQKVQLSPSQQLKFNRKSRKVGVENVETSCFTAWKDGLIKYQSLPLGDVVKSLEQLYNVKIAVLNPKIKEIIVSGSFSSEESIEETLDVISGSLPVKWEKKEDVFYIR